MKPETFAKRLHILVIVALIAILTVSLAPAQTARAEGVTTTSDLVVQLISIPKHAKACQDFEITFSVTNLGPDPASHINVGVGITDQFDTVGIMRAPDYLAVGETATVKAVIKVTAFVPGESRIGWVAPGAVSDPYPDTSIDPNPDNNSSGTTIKLISKQVMSCW
jgi:hypothetical protein